MPNSRHSRRLRSRAAVITVLVGAALIAAVVLLKPQPKPQPRPERPAPEVEVLVAAPGLVSLQVAAQGSVAPKVAVDLVARVSGQVVEVATGFAAGGYFAAGQALVQIERADYQFAVARARAQLAKADETLALERGRARQAKREWRDLGDDIANSLFLRQPQLAAAQAAQVAAQAELDKAELDLQRTTISLPFDGRVEQISVNVGQFVTAGSRLGRVYGSDQLELRLPLTLRQAELIDFPSPEQPDNFPAVEITLSDLLDQRSWQAKLVRSEASLDTRSRMLVAVAEISGPAAVGLPIGAFVEANIAGRSVSDALVLPRSALYRSDQILRVDDNRVYYQTVQVIQNREETVVVRGVEAGWQIVTTRLSLAINGMQIQIVDDREQAE